MTDLPAVQTFQYQLHNVRIIQRDGQPWFVRADVKRVLGMDNRKDPNLLESERGVTEIHTPGGPQHMVIISESGLYKLIMRSNKPEAEPFQTWVTSEVLPSIRTTGSYQASSQPSSLERKIDGYEYAARFLMAHCQVDAVFGIPKHLSLIEAVKEVKADTGLDFSEKLLQSPHMDMLPAADEYREISELTLRYQLQTGILNRWLAHYGYQTRLTDGTWAPTPTAEADGLARRHAWAKGSKSGYNLKWRVTFIDAVIDRVRQFAVMA